MVIYDELETKDAIDFALDDIAGLENAVLTLFYETVGTDEQVRLGEFPNDRDALLRVLDILAERAAQNLMAVAE